MHNMYLLINYHSLSFRCSSWRFGEQIRGKKRPHGWFPSMFCGVHLYGIFPKHETTLLEEVSAAVQGIFIKMITLAIK